MVHTQPGVTSESSTVLTVSGIETRSSGKKKAVLGAAVVGLVLAAGTGLFLQPKRSLPEAGELARPAANAPVLDAETKPRAYAPAPASASKVPPPVESAAESAPKVAATPAPALTVASSTPTVKPPWRRPRRGRGLPSLPRDR